MKMILVTIIVCLTMGSDAWADRSEEFRRALQVILTDNASIESLESAVQQLHKTNSNYDLTPISNRLESFRNHPHHPFLRVLEFVQVVGEIGILEAIPILLSRIRRVPVERVRADQWIQYDVKSTMEIAKKSAPNDIQILKESLNEILLTKFSEARGLEDILMAIVYAIRRVHEPSVRIITFIREQLNSPYSGVRRAAVYTVVDLSDSAVIQDVWKGKGINSEYLEDVRVNISKAVYVNDAVRNLPEIQNMLELARTNDPSPIVRQEVSETVEYIETLRKAAHVFQGLSLEQWQHIQEIIGIPDNIENPNCGKILKTEKR